MKKEPIKSQEEANTVFAFLVNETIKITECDKPQAEKRIHALLKSGVLKNGSPNNPNTQRKIDEFMTTHID
jgi:hypothetical protein